MVAVVTVIFASMVIVILVTIIVVIVVVGIAIVAIFIFVIVIVAVCAERAYVPELTLLEDYGTISVLCTNV